MPICDYGGVRVLFGWRGGAISAVWSSFAASFSFFVFTAVSWPPPSHARAQILQNTAHIAYVASRRAGKGMGVGAIAYRRPKSTVMVKRKRRAPRRI